MTERPFATAHLSEIDARDEWLPIRKHFGIEAFGVNAWRAAEPGGRLISEHDEASVEHQELYYVVSGHATFTVAGEAVEAPAGTLLFVQDPAVRRGAVARDADTTVLTVGAKPGEAFSVSPWESIGEAFDRDDYARAKELVVEQLSRRPDEAGHLYNLACAESRLGELEPALEHLLRAAELDERFREFAQTDPDLEAIRDCEGFPR